VSTIDLQGLNSARPLAAYIYAPAEAVDLACPRVAQSYFCHWPSHREGIVPLRSLIRRSSRQTQPCT